MFDIAEDQGDPPTIKQLSLFLPNRVGALLAVTRVLDQANIRLCALSVVDAADHAVVRVVVDRPTAAAQSLVESGYNLFETDLLAVSLPDESRGGIRKLLQALLLAELNVHYVYALLSGVGRAPVLALHVEDPLSASRVLRSQGLVLVGQDELG